MKNKKKVCKILAGIGYWIISLTWGGLLTIPGLFVTLFCIIFLKGKPHRNGFSYIVEVGGDWGGLEFGAVALCGSYSQKDGPCYNPYWYDHTRCHEAGHGIQTLIFGIFQLFLISIPSAVRYWIFEFRSRKGKPNPPYDDIWFEYTASKWGTKWINWIEDTNIEYTFERSKKNEKSKS